MPAIEADEELRAGPVPDAKLYDLVLAATGSEERAAAALSGRIALRNRRNETFGEQ
jgi:hypothetical protein